MARPIIIIIIILSLFPHVPVESHAWDMLPLGSKFVSRPSSVGVKRKQENLKKTYDSLCMTSYDTFFFGPLPCDVTILARKDGEWRMMIESKVKT